MLIKNNCKNGGKWNIAVITKLYTGRELKVRGAQLRLRKTTIDRCIQDLYPMEDFELSTWKKPEQMSESGSSKRSGFDRT